MECSFCGEEILTKIVMLYECFGCGIMLPNCQSDTCMDAMDCSNCLQGDKI